MLQASKMSSIPTRIPQQPPHAYGGHPGQAGRSPSKLQLMQQQMQQRYMREKEQKMQEYQYRNLNQNNSYQVVGQYHPENDLGPSEAGTVRKFFQERRELSDQNGYGQNINHHYKQVKQGGYQYQTNGNAPKTQVRNYGAIHDQRSNRYGRPPLPSKQSAGRDKSHPLAPIDRTPKQTPHGSRQSSRKSSAQSGHSHASNFNGKARPVRRGNQEPVPYESDAEQYQSNAEDNGVYSNRSNTNSPKKKSTSFREWQEKQKKIRQASAGQTNNESSSVPVQHFGSPNDDQGSGRKLSDFEKWQLEQDKQKQERLQKHREQNGHISNRSNHTTPRRDISSNTNPAYSPQSKKKLLNSRINSRKHVFPSESYNDNDDNGDEEDGDNEISQKQRELEEMIRRQQAELNRIQQEREAEDEKERKEKALRQKRAAEQRERQRKQREAEAKERREQEAREEKERRQREVEREMEEERLARQRAREQHDQPKIQQRYEYVDSENDEPPPFPRKASKPPRSSKQERRAPPPARQPPPPARVPPKEEYIPTPNLNDDGVAFYAQVAAEAEGNVKLDLAPCKVCGRKFARDRLDKHVKACKQTSTKKRKVFDPTKQRLEGTDAAKYQNTRSRRPEPKPKKSNWREQHENFIKTIRYAKAVTEAENTGGNVAALPPPPETKNSNFEKCPYCSRTFNPSAAERHIPRCKDLKTRPPPMKR